LLLIYAKLKPIIFNAPKEMTDPTVETNQAESKIQHDSKLSSAEQSLAMSAIDPLKDALCKVFHSSSKLNNGINLMEERIGKLEKQALDSLKTSKEAETSTLSIIDGMGAELSLVLDNVSILDSKLDGTIRLLKTGMDELCKRLTQLTVDINDLTNVKIKKK
jgi:hypothetical protein